MILKIWIYIWNVISPTIRLFQFLRLVFFFFFFYNFLKSGWIWTTFFFHAFPLQHDDFVSLFSFLKRRARKAQRSPGNSFSSLASVVFLSCKHIYSLSRNEFYQAVIPLSVVIVRSFIKYLKREMCVLDPLMWWHELSKPSRDFSPDIASFLFIFYGLISHI